MNNTAKFLFDLADRLDGWAEESRSGGWSTHQVKANREAANECRREAARLNTTEPMYLIWSNVRRAWWNPNKSGYTNSPYAAGRYTRDEALRICWDAQPGPQGIPVPEIMVPEKDARAVYQN